MELQSLAPSGQERCLRSTRPLAGACSPLFGSRLFVRSLFESQETHDCGASAGGFFFGESRERA